LGLFAGAYFWWPKVFGHFLNERRGKINFWAMLIGFNLTFGPMHVLGLQGMSRRIDTYSAGYGFDFWNLMSTIGSYLIAVSVLVFFYNVWKSKKEAVDLPPPGPDPWDARSLEWSVPSPTPEHNFDEVPRVESFDHWWFQKYEIDDDGKVIRIAETEAVAQDGSATGVHLPSPSFWPLVLAIGLPLIGYGIIFNLWLCVVGGLLTGGAIYAWVFEPVDDPDAGHDHDDHHDDEDDELTAVGAGSAGDEDGEG
ncbi:MAG: cytochrome c oxidase subunit 4, partial [Acidimicrobiales bacterium]